MYDIAYPDDMIYKTMLIALIVTATVRPVSWWSDTSINDAVGLFTLALAGCSSSLSRNFERALCRYFFKLVSGMKAGGGEPNETRMKGDAGMHARILQYSHTRERMRER
eukprot:IDg10618t1